MTTRSSTLYARGIACYTVLVCVTNLIGCRTPSSESALAGAEDGSRTPIPAPEDGGEWIVPSGLNVGEPLRTESGWFYPGNDQNSACSLRLRSSALKNGEFVGLTHFKRRTRDEIQDSDSAQQSVNVKVSIDESSQTIIGSFSLLIRRALGLLSPEKFEILTFFRSVDQREFSGTISCRAGADPAVTLKKILPGDLRPSTEPQPAPSTLLLSRDIRLSLAEDDVLLLQRRQETRNGLMGENVRALIQAGPQHKRDDVYVEVFFGALEGWAKLLFGQSFVEYLPLSALEPMELPWRLTDADECSYTEAKLRVVSREKARIVVEYEWIPSRPALPPVWSLRQITAESGGHMDITASCRDKDACRQGLERQLGNLKRVSAHPARVLGLAILGVLMLLALTRALIMRAILLRTQRPLSPESMEIDRPTNCESDLLHEWMQRLYVSPRLSWRPIVRALWVASATIVVAYISMLLTEGLIDPSSPLLRSETSNVQLSRGRCEESIDVVWETTNLAAVASAGAFASTLGSSHNGSRRTRRAQEVSHDQAAPLEGNEE